MEEFLLKKKTFAPDQSYFSYLLKRINLDLSSFMNINVDFYKVIDVQKTIYYFYCEHLHDLRSKIP